MTTTNFLRTAFFTGALFLSAIVNAQTSKPELRTTDLKVVELADDVTLHIISPEPIQFVDLSSDLLVGDMPAPNVARVKIQQPGNDSLSTIQNQDIPSNLGIITVVGQSFMAQYHVKYNYAFNPAITAIQIQPKDMEPLENTEDPLSATELARLSSRLLNRKPEKPIRKEKDLKLTVALNNVYIRDGYIFLDMSFRNKTNLPYTFDTNLFSIEDKKIYKATNNQSIELKPLFTYYKKPSFRKTFRNIYVFKKFTFPNSKVLTIRLTEKQISGRTVELKIRYSDVLKADAF